MRLSPIDPSTYAMHGAMAYAHFLAGRYDKASSCAESSLRFNPTFLLATCVFRSEQCGRGRLDLAQRAISRALEYDPDLRANNLRDLFRREEDFATFAKGLRDAGLPD
jgi:tetratricopeptide (TPR) repeat protein